MIGFLEGSRQLGRRSSRSCGGACAGSRFELESRISRALRSSALSGVRIVSMGATGLAHLVAGQLLGRLLLGGLLGRGLLLGGLLLGGSLLGSGLLLGGLLRRGLLLGRRLLRRGLLLSGLLGRSLLLGGLLGRSLLLGGLLRDGLLGARAGHLFCPRLLRRLRLGHRYPGFPRCSSRPLRTCRGPARERASPISFPLSVCKAPTSCKNAAMAVYTRSPTTTPAASSRRTTRANCSP